MINIWKIIFQSVPNNVIKMRRSIANNNMPWLVLKRKLNGCVSKAKEVLIADLCDDNEVEVASNTIMVEEVNNLNNKKLDFLLI